MTETPQPNPFTDVNPYRPGDKPPRQGELPDMAARRPSGLTAICIIAVVLGVLGLFSGLMKGVNVLFGTEMQQAFGSFGAVSPEQAKVQQDMQAAIAAEMNRFRLVNSVLCIAQLTFCGALVYSGMKTLGLKAAGRSLFLAACACMLVYEIGQSIAFVFQQLAMSPIMELYMPQLMKGSAGNNASAEQIGQVMARVSIILGIVFQCVWTLIKFVFYAVAIFHLRKAAVIALFYPIPTSAVSKPEPT